MKKTAFILFTVCCMFGVVSCNKSAQGEAVDVEVERAAAQERRAQRQVQVSTTQQNEQVSVSQKETEKRVSVPDPTGQFELIDGEVWRGTELLLKLTDASEITFLNDNHLYSGYESWNKLNYYFANEQTHELTRLFEETNEYHASEQIIHCQTYAFGHCRLPDKSICVFQVNQDGVIEHSVSFNGYFEDQASLTYDSYAKKIEWKSIFIDGEQKWIIDTENWTAKMTASLYSMDPKEAISTEMFIQKELSKDSITYTSSEGRSLSLKKDLSEITVDGVSYPCVATEESGMQFISFGGKKYLVLRSDAMCLLISQDESVFFCGYLTNYGKELSSSSVIKASSELSEKGVSYAASNLNNLAGKTPWVEGKADTGIGESITITSPYELDAGYGAMSGLIIFNGYISASNPALYKANARIKKIQVCNQNGTSLREFTLEDTPNPQVIIWNKQTEEVTLKIVSVYEGDKYTDTCLSALLPLQYISAWVFDVKYDPDYRF